MMFPLKDKYTIGYKHGDKTFYSNRHLGVDFICPQGTPIYAPFDCEVKQSVGKQGGNTLTVFWDKIVMRCMHLSKWGKYGDTKEGEVIGYVGSTGLSTAPHLHLDLSNNKVDINNFNNFINPEKFNWEEQMDYDTIAEYGADGAYEYLGIDKKWAKSMLVDSKDYIAKNAINLVLNDQKHKDKYIERADCDKRVEEAIKNAAQSVSEANTRVVDELNKRIKEIEIERNTLKSTADELREQLAKQPKTVDKVVDKEHTTIEYFTLWIKSFLGERR